MKSTIRTSAVLCTNGNTKTRDGNIGHGEMETRRGIEGREDLEMELTSDRIESQSIPSAIMTRKGGTITNATAREDQSGKIVRAAGTGTGVRTPGLVHAHGPHRLARARITSRRDVDTDHALLEDLLISGTGPQALEETQALEKTQASGNAQNGHHLYLIPTQTPLKQ